MNTYTNCATIHQYQKTLKICDIIKHGVSVNKQNYSLVFVGIMESTEDFSLDLETTVPTDLSISPDETSEFGLRDERKKYVSKQLYERKQLQHDLQVCGQEF